MQSKKHETTLNRHSKSNQKINQSKISYSGLSGNRHRKVRTKTAFSRVHISCLLSLFWSMKASEKITVTAPSFVSNRVPAFVNPVHEEASTAARMVYRWLHDLVPEQRLKWGGRGGSASPAPIWAPHAIVWAPLIESIKCYFMPK